MQVTDDNYFRLSDKKLKWTKWKIPTFVATLVTVGIVGYYFSTHGLVDHQNVSQITQNGVSESEDAMVMQKDVTQLLVSDHDENSYEQFGIEDELEFYNQDCQAARSISTQSQANQFRNWEKLEFGYNIFKGTPFQKNDDGYNNKVFAVNRNGNQFQMASNGQYYPAELGVSPLNSCQTSLSQQTMTSASDLQKSFQAEVSISGGGSYGVLSGSFTASASYKTASRKLENEQKGLSIASATCRVYQLKQKPTPPCISQQVLDELDNLNDNYGRKQQFFNYFGTHAITKIDMGSKYVASAEFNRATQQLMKSQGYGLQFSAEASAFGYSAGGSSDISGTKSSMNQFGKSFENENDYTIGTMPPGGNTIQEKLNNWRSNHNEIKNSPQPIANMRLIPLTEAIEKSLQRRGELNTVRKMALQQLNAHLTQGSYCKGLNGGETCTDPVPNSQTQSYTGYESLGEGYCNDWKYLSEGDYPDQLSSGSCYRDDKRLECQCRCAQQGYPNAFYVDGDQDCACSRGYCSGRTESDDDNYYSYKTKTFTIEKPLHGFTYDYLGRGYCSNFKYLPEGDYPNFLRQYSPLFDPDRVRECGNRCRAASIKDSSYSAQAFYIRNDGKCGCAKDQCYSRSSSDDDDYFSYRMQNN